MLFLVLGAFSITGCMVVNGYDPVTGLVFQDDFSNPDSGWPVYEKPAGKTAYYDGYYQLEILVANAQLTAPLPSDFRIPPDVQITVEAEAIQGQPAGNDYFGIICRYQDPYNYYFLVISQDGYYGIGKMKAGSAALLHAAQMLPVEAILQEGKNLLQAACAGSSLALSINGVLVGSVQDAEWGSGGIGLLAASGDRGEQLVAFDRLLVQVVR